jgi:hypothetical protein
MLGERRRHDKLTGPWMMRDNRAPSPGGTGVKDCPLWTPTYLDNTIGFLCFRVPPITHAHTPFERLMLLDRRLCQVLRGWGGVPSGVV